MKFIDIENCISVVHDADGWRLGFSDGTERAPTPSEEVANAQAIKKGDIRVQAQVLIESKWPQWRQQNCALGVYPDAVAAECADDIASVIAASNAAEDAIDAATTVQEVEAVTATWPTL